VPGCRMDDQARGFVDDGEMLVLEDELEWNGGRAYSAGCFVLADLNSYHLTAHQHARGAGNFTIDSHQLVGHKPCGLSA
jgi:hypothetical protein